MITGWLAYYFVCSAIHLTSAGAFGPLPSDRVSVHVSDVLNKGGNQDNQVDKSWPPPNSQEYARVNIKVLGKPIDPTILNNIQPDTTLNKQRKLRRILGNLMNTQWTSVDHPRVLRQSGNSPDPKLASDVRNLNITVRDKAGVQLEPSEEQAELFRSWMLRLATCTMDYIWEDLGPLFWPRWIRRGICINPAGRSCSWPPGMMCRPSGSQTLHLLHWKCEDASRADENRQRSARNSNWRRRNRNRKRDEYGLNQDERRKRRVRRIIKKLSVESSGYYCEWQVQRYLISDKCSCSCS